MRLAKLVRDTISKRVFRITPKENVSFTPMYSENAFDIATGELTDLLKSRKRLAETVGAMSDAKDYGDVDSDSFDRRPQGARRRDMRESWRGIQAMDEELAGAIADEEVRTGRLFDDAEIEDADRHYEMLVSGRPSRIRFPGAHGDSTLHPIDSDGYVTDEEDPNDELEGRGRLQRRNSALRARLGGDAMSWRTSASRRGVGEDEYGAGKSFGYRTRRVPRRSLRPIDLIPGSPAFNLCKSRIHDAVSAGEADPDILLVLDGASDARFGQQGTMRLAKALGAISEATKRRFGIPDLSGVFVNPYQWMGQYHYMTR